jgi:hypothetical protein
MSFTSGVSFDFPDASAFTRPLQILIGNYHYNFLLGSGPMAVNGFHPVAGDYNARADRETLSFRLGANNMIADLRIYTRALTAAEVLRGVQLNDWSGRELVLASSFGVPSSAGADWDGERAMVRDRSITQAHFDPSNANLMLEGGGGIDSAAATFSADPACFGFGFNSPACNPALVDDGHVVTDGLGHAGPYSLGSSGFTLYKKSFSLCFWVQPLSWPNTGDRNLFALGTPSDTTTFTFFHMLNTAGDEHYMMGQQPSSMTTCLRGGAGCSA